MAYALTALAVPLCFRAYWSVPIIRLRDYLSDPEIKHEQRLEEKRKVNTDLNKLSDLRIVYVSGEKLMGTDYKGKNHVHLADVETDKFAVAQNGWVFYPKGKKIFYLNLNNGVEKKLIQGRRDINEIAVSLDGIIMAYTNDIGLMIGHNKKRKGKFLTKGEFKDICISPTAKYLAGIKNKELWVYNLETEETKSYDCFKGYPDPKITWLNYEDKLAFIHKKGEENFVNVVDITNGENIEIFRGKELIFPGIYDEKNFVTASRKSSKVYWNQNGEERSFTPKKKLEYHSFSYSNGKILFIANIEGEADSELFLFNTSTNKLKIITDNARNETKALFLP